MTVSTPARFERDVDRANRLGSLWMVSGHRTMGRRKVAVMGSAVIASCTCGLEKEFMIGGGMMDFTTVCHFPCLCESCNDIVDANLLSKEPRCSECNSPAVIPYDDPKLSSGNGVHEVAFWNTKADLGRKLVLTDADYKCPKCRQMTLCFSDAHICWD